MTWTPVIVASRRSPVLPGHESDVPGPDRRMGSQRRPAATRRRSRSARRRGGEGASPLDSTQIALVALTAAAGECPRSSGGATPRSCDTHSRVFDFSTPLRQPTRRQRSRSGCHRTPTCAYRWVVAAEFRVRSWTEAPHDRVVDALSDRFCGGCVRPVGTSSAETTSREDRAPYADRRGDRMSGTRRADVRTGALMGRPQRRHTHACGGRSSRPARPPGARLR